MTEDTGQQPVSMWESIKRGLQDGAAVVVGKAEELTQVGRARLDVAAAKARIGRLYGDLGAEVYAQVSAGGGGGVGDSEDVRALCQQIAEAEQALRQDEAALEGLRAELEVEEGPEDESAGSP